MLTVRDYPVGDHALIGNAAKSHRVPLPGFHCARHAFNCEQALSLHVHYNICADSERALRQFNDEVPIDLQVTLAIALPGYQEFNHFLLYMGKLQAGDVFFHLHLFCEQQSSFLRALRCFAKLDIVRHFPPYYFKPFFSIIAYLGCSNGCIAGNFSYSHPLNMLFSPSKISTRTAGLISSLLPEVMLSPVSLKSGRKSPTAILRLLLGTLKSDLRFTVYSSVFRDALSPTTSITLLHFPFTESGTT